MHQSKRIKGKVHRVFYNFKRLCLVMKVDPLALYAVRPSLPCNEDYVCCNIRALVRVSSKIARSRMTLFYFFLLECSLSARTYHNVCGCTAQVVLFDFKDRLQTER